MKVAYCSILLPEEKKLSERVKKRLPGISLHKFTKAVIKGVDANLDEPVSIFNIINTLNYPNFPELIFHTEQWEHTKGSRDWHIGYINLFGIKYMTQERGLYKKLKAWKNQYPNEKCVICVHHIYLPAMRAACRMKKKFGDGVVTCLITGDMNGKYGLKSQYKPNLKQRLIKAFVDEPVNKLARKFDSFVFVTKYMAEAFGVSDKPHTVLECTYTDPDYASGIGESEEAGKIIFYAGAVREEYGIPHLLRAFSMIEDKDYRLWIAGGGNAEDMVREYAARDPRIEFLGFITPQEVFSRQQQCMALISPRTSEHEFVKYSFASKTVDSLASGKPYIAHCLPCDPPEYADHIQYAKDESDTALRDKIVEICEMTPEERKKIGESARKFILTEKSPEVMCRRIVDLWGSL